MSSMQLMLVALCVARTMAKHRIIGGRNDDARDFPYVVRLETAYPRMDGYEWYVLCSGSLLTNQWVLTAAHCLVPELTTIRYGDVTLPRKDSNTSNILLKIIHPKFWESWTWVKVGGSMKNDIGLLLIETIQMEIVGKLAAVDYKTLLGKKVTIAGYGAKTFYPNFLDTLKAEKTPLQIGEGLIFKILNEDFLPALMVASKCTTPMHGISNGDSGGPLLANGKVIGVASVSSSDSPVTQLFTPVSPYLDWIYDITANTKQIIQIEKYK